MKQELLIQSLERIKKNRVGIIGDFCLDVYWEVNHDKKNISVETLKVINQVSSQKCSLGGAGNLALNIKDLNVSEVKLFGIIGDDLFGRELLNLMKLNRLNTDGIFTQKEDWLTNVYIKPMMGPQEQNRFDLGFKNDGLVDSQDLVLAQLEKSLLDLDIVIINQQWIAGIHTQSFRERLSQIIQKTEIPFIVDSRNFPCDYHGAIRKMNDFELLSLYQSNLKPQDKINTEELKSAGLDLSKKFKKMIIVTRGNKSTFLIKDNSVNEIPSIEVFGEIDTVGAGDSFLAGFSCLYGASNDASLGIEMGNLVASITIKKLRETGTAKPEELLNKNKENLMVTIEESNIHLCGKIPKNITLTHAIFDHDGTLSVIRRGWESVMSQFMYLVLTNGSLVENEEELKVQIIEFIAHTTGIRTLEQMDGLIDMIKKKSNVPAAQIKTRYEYKQIYLDSLMKRVKQNIDDIKNKEISANDFLIKGTIPFLNELKMNLKEIYLASGTDEKDVRNEATILGLNTYFNGGIFGARDELDYDIKSFVIEQISNKIGRNNMKNTIVIGDGPVEIREGRKWGAFTIGVASNEDTLVGVNNEKKMRLIKAGAHVIIGDYQELDKIMALLNIKVGVVNNAF